MPIQIEQTPKREFAEGDGVAVMRSNGRRETGVIFELLEDTAKVQLFTGEMVTCKKMDMVFDE